MSSDAVAAASQRRAGEPVAASPNGACGAQADRVRTVSAAAERVDRGFRHAEWTLAAMLYELVRNERAHAERPLAALLLGCGDWALAARLPAWGASRVLALDAPIELGDERFDLAIADGRAGRLGAEPGALEPATAAPLCVLIAPDLAAGAATLRAAGFASPELLEPPADAERRFITHELNLMVARPDQATHELGEPR